MVEYTIKAACTVSRLPKPRGVLLCMKLQSIISTNDSPETLTVVSPPESVKPVYERLSQGRPRPEMRYHR